MLKKGDLVLFIIIAAAIAASMAVPRFLNSGHDVRTAVIKQDDKVIKTIDLDSVQNPEKIEVNGEYTDVILVEKGRIRFDDADCPNKDCVKTGWLTRSGDVAVCLPNHTMIKIEGRRSKVDGVVY